MSSYDKVGRDETFANVNVAVEDDEFPKLGSPSVDAMLHEGRTADASGVMVTFAPSFLLSIAQMRGSIEQFILFLRRNFCVWIKIQNSFF